MGARHRPHGQHPAGRGQQRLVQRLVDGGRLCPPRRRRGGRVDELGRRRVLRREQLRQLFHYPQRPRRRNLPGRQRRQRRPGRLSGDLLQRAGRRRHHAFAGRGGQLPQRIGLERQRRRHSAPTKPNRPTSGPWSPRPPPSAPTPTSPTTPIPTPASRSTTRTTIPSQRPGGSGAEPATPHRNGRRWWPSPIRDACWPARDSLDGATQTLPLLYSLSSADFHDITTGTSTGSPRYSAAPGYDLVTGRGSPVANLVVGDLVAEPPRRPPPPRRSFSARSWPRPRRRTASSNPTSRASSLGGLPTPAAITVKSLTVDGVAASATYGPFGPLRPAGPITTPACSGRWRPAATTM